MATNFIMTSNTANGRWDLTYTVDSSGLKEKTLKTRNMFVDRDIKVGITIPAAVVTPNTGSITLTPGSGGVSLSANNGDSGSSTTASLNLLTTAPTSGVYYTIAASGWGVVSGTGKGSVNVTSGWITNGSLMSSNSTASSATSNSATTTGYIIKSIEGNVVTGSLPNDITPARAAGTYQDIMIYPNGYINIPAGYNPKDRYIFAQKASTQDQSILASGFGLNITSLSSSNEVTIGTLSGNYYPIIGNNLSASGSFTATNAGWFKSATATDASITTATVGKMMKASINGTVEGGATLTVAPGVVSVTAGGAVNNKTKISIVPVSTTSTIDTYYIAIKGVAGANGDGATTAISKVSGLITVATAGYAAAGTSTNINLSGTARAYTSEKIGSDYYLPIPTAVGAWQAGTSTNATVTPGLTKTGSLDAVTSAPTGTEGTDYWKITSIMASSQAGTYKACYKTTSAGWTPTNNEIFDTTARSVGVTANTGGSYYIKKAVSTAVYATTAALINITSAGYLPTGNIQTMTAISPTFQGGELSVLTSISGTNVIFGNSNTSGIIINSVSSATRTAVTYAATAIGYICKKPNDSTGMDGTSLSNASPQTKYITALTLPKDKTLSITTVADTALDTTSDLDITNAAYRRVDIVNNANGTVLIDNSGNTTITNKKTTTAVNTGTITVNSGSSTTGSVVINAYTTATNGTLSLSGVKTIVTAGKWNRQTITPTKSTKQGPYYGETYVQGMNEGDHATIAVTGGGLVAGNGSSSLISNGYYNGTTCDTNDKISLATGITGDGYYRLTSFGYGEVSRTAIFRQVTADGYAPADLSPVEAIAASSACSSNTASTLYYIKKSLLSTTNVTISNASTTITVGEGYYPSARTITVNAPTSTTVVPEVNTTGITNYFNSGTANSYIITLQPKYTNTAAGYIDAHTGTSGNGAIQRFSIKLASVTTGPGAVELSAGDGHVTLSAGTGDSESSSNTSMAMATSTPSSGVYYTINASGWGTVSGRGSGSVNIGQGWIPTAKTVSSTWSAVSTMNSNANTATGYIIKSVHGSTTSGIPSTTILNNANNICVEIQPNSYLKVPAGYNPKDRYIYVKKADTAVEAILAGNFTLDVSSVSSTATVTVGAYNTTGSYYPIQANNLTISGTLTASTAGWFSSGAGTDTAISAATVGRINPAVISGSVTAGKTSSGNFTVAPGDISITTATANITGKTKLSIAPESTTSGIDIYYIPIKGIAAANNTGTLTNIGLVENNISVTTAGYIPSGNISSNTNVSISVTGSIRAYTSEKTGANYYLPIPTAAGSWQTGNTVNAIVNPIVGTSTGLTLVTTAPSGTENRDYWKITPAITDIINGSYAASYKITTAGWLALNQEINSAAHSVGVTESTSKQIYYIQKATYTANGGVIKSVNAGYVPSNTAVYSFNTVTPTFTGGTLSVNSTIGTSSNTDSYLITDGTNSSCGAYISSIASATRTAVTYSATAIGYIAKNSGTQALAAGNVVQTNPSIVYVNGVKIFAPTTGTRYFDITVPNGNTTDFITFRFTVDSEGNVTVNDPNDN